MSLSPSSQSGLPQRSRRRGLRPWLGCSLLLLGLPILVYYGYCWGVWGRQSLLLQYLFQCSCPTASEEARYPDEVDVIVPACNRSSVVLSPSGRFLKVSEEKSGSISTHILDLQTMQQVPTESFSRFLTDELWFVEKGLEDYIIDQTTGKQYSITIFRFWQSNAYLNDRPNHELLVTTMRQAERIFLNQNNDTVIVLMPNFSNSFTFDRSDIPGAEANKVERFLQENDIIYQTIMADFPDEVISPDGRYLARNDGIYLIETNQKIADGYSLSVRGWTYDGRGVIYSHVGGHCLILISLPFGDDTGCFRRVPQPVIVLDVPNEYILPSQSR